MKPNIILTSMALCATACADPSISADIITDPSKITNSATYDLGDHLMTIQELTKDALPVVPPAPQTSPQPARVPRPAIQRVERGFLNIGGTAYRRNGQPTRSLITYYPQGSAIPITFWSSADWSLLTGVGQLADSSGKIWQQMCMISPVDLDRKAGRFQMRDTSTIPSFPEGAATYLIVSGNPPPGAMAPVELFLSYYDAHLAELQAACKKRSEEQARQAAEELANPPVPEDIVVQYRIMKPEEIVTPDSTQISPAQ